MLEKLRKNVCRIFLDKIGNGTGFLISSKFILTNYHVVSEIKEIKVKFYNDDDLYKVILVEIDEKYKQLDIALLELENKVDHYQNILIEDKECNGRERWMTRGYPSIKNNRGEEMTNEKHTIHQVLPKLDIEGFFDIELNSRILYLQ